MDTKPVFDAEEFVALLMDEGANIPCDETHEKFTAEVDLPHFYDKQLYDKGRQFYNTHVFALFYGKLLGLLSILSIPSILNILMLTRMSGTPMSAYKRYLATIFHMCIWYDEDFSPGSTVHKSLREVKGKHNSASKRGCCNGLLRISQKDMALTQFGFMGFAVAKRDKIGIHKIRKDELEGFVHIWRVVGAALGLEDRFNICRESVDETTQICNVLLSAVFRPHLTMKDENFVEMGRHLISGMWAMNPTLNFEIFLYRAHYLTYNSSENEAFKPLLRLNRMGEFINWLHNFVMWTLQFTIFRLYHNYQHFMSIWLMKVCPFLAYYKFGYANSHVQILTSRTTITDCESNNNVRQKIL